MKIVHTTDAPIPIGHYSQGVCSGNFYFFSGQIPLLPDGSLIEGGIVFQTRQVLENIAALLRSQNLHFSDVGKVTVFITNMGEFQQVNEIFAEFFGDHRPARSTVEVSRLPKDALIEIEVTAHKSSCCHS